MDLNAIAGSRWPRLVLAFLAGASTSLAFAPYSLWSVYPIAIALSLWLSQGLSPKAAFGHWLSFGFGSFAFGISWVHVSIDRFGGLPLVVSLSLMALLALYLALYPALAGMLYARLKTAHALPNLLLLFPALWILTEWARGWMLTGFPWLWAGYSQTDGPLLPLAAFIGVQGIGALVLVCAGALALLSQKRGLPLAFLLPVLALLVFMANRFPQVERSGETLKVLLVQGNIPQSMKWEPEQLWPTMLKYMDLSRPHADADIILWPEAAIPAPESMVADFLDNANRVANLNNNAIITGIISHQDNHWYNSLIVLGNHHEKVQQEPDYEANGTNRFRKHHLLPIGEFVPFESLLRPLAPFFNLPMSSFSRGDYLQPNLLAAGFQLAPAICYEIAFPEQLRQNVTEHTDLLLTVSNDAWFGESNGPLQHMEIARMRSAELGRPLLRATNNGVTAVVDEFGQISEAVPQFETQVLKADVALTKGTTLFARTGHLPLYLLCVLIVLAAWGYRRKQAHR
ncbi:apolipoprotein N-acyltransferase [Shewanella litorisediminis]|uniref:Apolipoprotein N-acyltransferase n=1 Tax=Shewanella litorisediminis TaxID=1173586 RepID=A0ABX7G0R3_9GAMM|nr:apolipoprotein N-acyltransferase [Shewanella litorisediminis]MCL2918078.1 apolipoprotein N-acyltransferase [Shewanella litorisediminis]QRH00861.1 apolipoprotein N-acyltransferase [Shewanella litorisediminis]